MYVRFVKYSSVLSLIYSKQLILSIESIEGMRSQALSTAYNLDLNLLWCHYAGLA
jgi:hypothetical protein